MFIINTHKHIQNNKINIVINNDKKTNSFIIKQF